MAARTQRVLVVDADPMARLAVDRQLEALGWEAVPVEASEDAVHIVDLGFIIDVLLTDLTLPDGTGPALAAAVSKASPGTRIAFMSSAIPRGPLEPRDAPLLIKPFTMDALANALAGAIALYPR